MPKVPALVGIDLGQTRTKVLVIDLSGRQLGVAVDATQASHPRSLWAERNLDVMWGQACAAMRAALASAGSDIEVLAVGVSGHSDGLYLVDEKQRSTRPAILATDARARTYAKRLAEDATGARLLELTGQLPMPASPGVVTRWLRDHEPAVLEDSRWLLSSTDWLRMMLTGTISTDLTMAAASYVGLGATSWSEEALELYGLADLLTKLPPVVASEEVIGTVTAAAASACGLASGTPVVAGAHDVDTGAVGLGALKTGAVSLLLGTYSINQVVGDAPLCDPRWQVRPLLRTGPWLHMSTSPAGAGCLDWAASRLGPHNALGGPDAVAALTEAQSQEPSLTQPHFLPFVHGGPPGAPVGGSWVGLRSEHDRPSMLRAVAEGVAFNHRSHMDALATRVSLPSTIRVGGGGARSAWWTQLLCDSLGKSTEVTESLEVSALGAAVLAGTGVGAYPSLDCGVAMTVRVKRRHDPNPDMHALLDARYTRYREIVDSLGRILVYEPDTSP